MACRRKLFTLCDGIIKEAPNAPPDAAGAGRFIQETGQKPGPRHEEDFARSTLKDDFILILVI
jgi:hypothetical protein